MPKRKHVEVEPEKQSKKVLKTDGESSKNEQEETFVFFFGKKFPFSQHYMASFKVGEQTFNCAEQYMMYTKAVTFKDEAMKTKIMSSSNPVAQKKFGRQVKNFAKDVWTERAESIVREASKAKFSQNPELKAQLVSTHPHTLVEASPRDRIWGIGLGASNPKARDRKQWRGRNKLGFILTQVRDEIMEEDKDHT